jgi:TolB protein
MSTERLKTLVAITAVALSCLGGRAAETIGELTRDLVPGNTPPIWLNITGLGGEALRVLQFDLYVQGFNFTNADNAQYLIKGTSNGDLQGWVTDRVNKNPLVSNTYKGAALRQLVHAFADDFVSKLDRQGIARTRIAANVETKSGYSEIYLADFDGANEDAVTRDGSLAAGPSCVPGTQGKALCYTSFKLGSPAIFYHDRARGVRNRIAWYGGSNLSPAVSPDRRRVAMILGKDAMTDLYVADIDGGNLRRLTRSKEDESGPCWSPDGNWICFATRNDKERRVLCKIAPTGGSAQLIKTPGIQGPSEPDWSPDGQWIAFTAQMGGFQICVLKVDTGEVTPLVAGEDPSWSPNSRTLVFMQRGRLSLLDVPTKQVKDVARISSGANNQPSWAR